MLLHNYGHFWMDNEVVLFRGEAGGLYPKPKTSNPKPSNEIQRKPYLQLQAYVGILSDIVLLHKYGHFWMDNDVLLFRGEAGRG
jgi:hypothetical protein